MEAGQILIRLSTDYQQTPGQKPEDHREFVIVGSGAAGACAAQSLREAGYHGGITLIGADHPSPYDRPALSKNYLAGRPLDHPLPLQPADYYAKLGIARRTGRVASINIKNQEVILEQQGAIRFDALLLAPGATPRKLGVEGEDLAGVFALRTLSDCDAILAAASGAKRAVVIGSGFIGMEAGANLRERGLDVTIVTPEKTPMASKVGDAIGKMFQSAHEAHGVRFMVGKKVARFEGGSRLTAVKLETGESIDADLALVAVGVRPATDFLKGTLPLEKDGSIAVDEHMRVAEAANIFAAGDATTFPYRDAAIRIEHWRTAEQLGRAAAFNMAGGTAVFDDVPFFWSFQFDVGLDYVGHAATWDAIHIDGDIGERKFLAYYLQGDRVAAVGGCNRSDETCAIAELMRADRMPRASEIKGGVDWKKALINPRSPGSP